MTALKALWDRGAKVVTTCFKVGLIGLVPFGVLVVIVVSIWNFTTAWGWHFLGNRFLNFLINLSLLLALVCVLGFIFQRPSLKNFIDSIFKNLPIVSWFFEFFPSGDQLERFKTGSYPEVIVEISPGIYFRGIIVKEIVVAEKELYRVLLPTTPVPMTGNLLEVEKNKVIFTGRNFKETSRTYLSIGTQ